MKKVDVEITDHNTVYVDGIRVTGRHTKWGVHTIICTLHNIRKDQVRQAIVDAGYGNISLDEQFCLEMGI